MLNMRNPIEVVFYPLEWCFPVSVLAVITMIK